MKEQKGHQIMKRALSSFNSAKVELGTPTRYFFGTFQTK